MKIKRLFLAFSLLISVFCVSGCQIQTKGVGEEITKEFSFGKIDNLVVKNFRLNGSNRAKINLIDDNEQKKVEVVSYSNFINSFTIKVEDRTLIISGDKNKVYSTNEIVFNVYGYRFMNMDVNCGALIKADNNCASPMGCTINASNGSEVNLGDFYCYRFNANITNGSKLKIGDMDSPEAHFYADSGSTIKTSVLKGEKYYFDLKNGSSINAYSYVYSPIEEASIKLQSGSIFDCLGVAVQKCSIDFSMGSSGKAWVINSLSGSLIGGSTFTFAGTIVETNINVALLDDSQLIRMEGDN